MLAIIFTLLMVVTLGASLNDVQRLELKLFRNYDTSRYPEHMRLKYGIVFTQCPSMDPSGNGKLTSHILENYAWTDNRLHWLPDLHGDIADIPLSVDRVWTPGVRLANGQTANDVSSTEVLRLWSTGELKWVRSGAFNSDCDLIRGVWKCQLRFQSLKYAGDEFRMVLHDYVQDVIDSSMCPRIQVTNAAIERVGLESSPFYYYVVDLEVPVEF